MLQEMIRYLLVCGIDSKVIQGTLLAEADLSLDKAVEIAVAMETAETNAQKLKLTFKHSSELQSEVCRLEEPHEPSSLIGGRRFQVGKTAS